MKKTILCSFLAVFAWEAPVQAIPNSFFGNGNAVPIIPAFPRFNSDLTEEFLDHGKWQNGGFSGPWREEASLPDLKVKRMTANPIVMGEVPMSVVAYSDGSETQEIAIHFLDAGLFFGYRFGGEQTEAEREAGKARRKQFSEHMETLLENLEERLEDGCGRGVKGTLGRTPELRTEFTEFAWENFVLRLVEREDHSVSLHIFQEGSEPRSLVDSNWAEASRRDRQERLEEAVIEEEDGSVRIVGVPVLTQGMTPYCGIHSLAMVSRYIGMKTSPEALAAGAEFKNTGSAGGSDMVGLHRAVATELDMRVSIAPRLDRSRFERSIRAGLPVIVWRRVSQQRENFHARVAEQSRQGKGSPLPELGPEDLALLPPRGAKGSPSHASVLTGWSADGGEIYYLEPWGKLGQGRRMRWEELEATAYAVFHFKL
ncbi:MAG: hypothetical protein P1U85_06505 [Verrucomicrobiales bacterium]|nr:hypothetical protein [Verrucomicrobiales bacterium]